ncbi:hypothetical protein COZ60_01830 [Candidatus Bathyarchaeota archaeon CG_4_8_14_3_um_filter_42_8]|nr:MAG: hypothetical protein COZ60_01830 [Candidatus Bathyarchaeota archaeon CG_4_8_14_3_um_filter_42_8]
MKATVGALKELNESYVELIQAMKGTIKEVKTTRQLWQDGKKSRLIKLGLALIVFPEPTPISETIGTFLVAAGAVQAGIRRRTIYVENVYKSFKDTLKEMRSIKDSL